MKISLNTKFKEILFIGSIAFFLLLIITFRTNLMTYDHPDFLKPWDHHKYIHMANHPFSFHIAPFCWRIINPLIVYNLPFEISINFFLISFFSLLLTVVLLYYIFQQLKFSKSLSVLGVIIFLTLGWATKQILYDFWLPDGMSFLIITAGIFLIFNKNQIGFIILVTVGILVKEIVILLLPLYYSIHAKRIFDKPLILKTVLVSILPITVLIAVRIFIPAMNNNLNYLSTLPSIISHTVAYESLYNFMSFINSLNFNVSILEILKNVMGTYGVVLVFFSFFNLKENLNLFFRFLPLILPSLLVIFFPIINTQRLMIISFPLLIILALNGVQFLITKFNINMIYFYSLALALFIGNLIEKDLIFLQVRYQIIIFSLFLLPIMLRIITRKYSNESNLLR